jgi:hypothetical protein
MLAVVVATQGAHPGSVLFFVPAQLAFSGTGTVIAIRRPTNAVGWLFVAFGALGSLALVAIALSGGIDLNLETANALAGPLANPAIQQWSAWVATLWTELALLPILLALLLFPTGHFLTRRWAWVGAGAVAVAVFGTVTTGISDVNFHTNYTTPDPVQLVDRSVMTPLYGTYQAAEIALMLLTVSGLIVRYRRSDTVGRAQLRWVTYAGVMLVTGFLAAIAVNIEPVWAFIAFLPLVPLTVMLAILRYRLFEIDRIISRTISYTMVSGLIVLTYVVVVSLVTRLLSDSSNLAVAAATLLSAALVRPVLHRVQAAVDRRFNRPRFQATDTVDQLGIELRRHVEVAEVEKLLVDAVRQTLQPTSLSLRLVAAT